MKVEIKRVKDENKFKVTMELTEGAILALKHSLQFNQLSAVSQDLHGFVVRAGEQAGIKW